ncbi:MAG: hypothetical protein JNK85_07805 [Verrucomicrobiales bacterium]|nr:hypothetical protein [Verrucomicrobiales bacterium]
MKGGLGILGWLASVMAAMAGAEQDSVYSDTRHGNAPPVDVTYSLPSALSQGGRELGDVDSLAVHVGYVVDLPAGASWRWLVGADYRLLTMDVPQAAALPSTLQSAALVVGFHGRWSDRWQVRLEVLPGLYGDPTAMDLDHVNAPLILEVAYTVSERLTLGAQVLVDARRESPVVGSLGVTWRWSERWGLALWLPRPQIEFSPDERWTVFLGASLNGGTFGVANDFGARHGDPRLDGAAVDYREIRVGGGARFRVGERYLAEASVGWTVDRRYHFHEAGVLLNGDGAPYVQVGFGRTF